MPRRVFILWKNPLFHETLRLLLTRPEIEIVGDSVDFLTIQTDFSSLEPDTVVIEEIEGQPIVSTETFQILEALPWRIRIIRLSLSDNELWIYYSERWLISDEQDLLKLIEANE